MVKHSPLALSINGLKKTYVEHQTYRRALKRLVGFDTSKRVHTQAVKGLDIEIKSGDFYALLGPNGAGKSTTIGIICGLVTKTEGEVKVNGISLDDNPSLARTHIGLVPQEFNINIFERVQDIVMNEGGYYGMPRSQVKVRTEILLKKMGLWDKRNMKARELSGGMKRRLMIARGLIHDPSILILDEPTAGVDIEIRRDMWSFLRELNAEGKTIILTTHYLEEAEELCNNVAIIAEGNLLTKGPMSSFLKQLDNQVFVVTTMHDEQELRKLSFPELQDVQIKVVKGGDLEITIKSKHSVNESFVALNNLDIQISSIRPKVNRLEELFMQKTAKNIEPSS